MANLGVLRKMRVEYSSPVRYFLKLDNKEIELSANLGHSIRIRHTGEIHCIQCDRKTPKSFQQGYCYPCMQRLMECNLCLIHPERCLVEKGTCPHDDWAHAQCASEQVLYLANSSGLKVGISRQGNLPTRWIDQGAIQGMPIFSAKNRYQIGLVEVALKSMRADKTNWRVMLKNEVTLMDLALERDQLIEESKNLLAPIMQKYVGQIEMIKAPTVEINYPVTTYPTKITSLSLDKTPLVSGVLHGIKGQYLLLDTGVINIRKFAGYNVEVEI